MADFNEKINELNNTKDTTAEFDQADIENNKIMGILAYISFLVLVPILAAKDSKFARFHANQGLVLLIASIASGIIIGALGILPLIGWIFSIVGAVVEIATVIFMVLGIVNAAQGRAKELPVIGGIKILK